MKFLLCAEFFHPSVGGVQEVVKQIALRLVSRGHDVTVATTHIQSRTDSVFGGVKIVGFSVGGNLVRGMYGEIDRYREFVLGGNYDAVFIYAAQQWTLDALLDVLPAIKTRKVLVPCGFSGFYLSEYQIYFKRLAIDLTHFDALVFHSRRYRDYEFAVGLGLRNCMLIPNGASEQEFFTASKVSCFRERCGIPSEAFVILTVGSLNGAKGHLEVTQAVSRLKSRREICLILNGNQMPTMPKRLSSQVLAALQTFSLQSAGQLLRQVAWHGLRVLGLRRTYVMALSDLVTEINKGRYGKGKRAMIVDLPRTDLIECFFDADLFVFASKIEYSPLVLFESAAAGLPFLTTPVGNAKEIAAWTGAGRICPALLDDKGYTSVDPTVLADHIDELICDDQARIAMGSSGRATWQKYFTWDVLTDDYEKILTGGVIESKAFEECTIG